MLLLHLMSKKETEEAIELLKSKLHSSKERYGLNDNRTIELNRQLSLYIHHLRNLTTQDNDIRNKD